MRAIWTIILFIVMFLNSMVLIGCWKSIQLEADVAVTPKQVYQGESVTIVLESKEDLFVDYKYNVTFLPGNGFSSDLPIRKSIRTLKIPIEVDKEAAPGPRILSLKVGELIIEKEIEVLPAADGIIAGESAIGPFATESENEDEQLSISPDTVARGERVTFAVTGENTDFSSDTTVSFGPDSGIAIDHLDIRSSTELSFNGNVAVSAVPGIRTLYVSGPSGQTVDVLSVDVEVSPIVTCYVDAYENNNDIGHATPLNFPSRISASICAGDHDYFKINVQAGMVINYFLQFTHSDGDLDMELLTLQGARLALAESRTDNELITFTVPANQSGERVLRIYGYNNAVNNYTLNVEAGGIDTDTGEDTEIDTDTNSDTNTDTETDTQTDSDTSVLPVCPNPGFTVDPPVLSIGRYSARLTIKADDNPEWMSDTTTVALPDAPDNIALEGCTVTTPWQISCNITVGLFAVPGDIRIDVNTGQGETACGVLTVDEDGIAESEIPTGVLPNVHRYLGDIDARAQDRSDFFHIQPNADDMLVFHAVSLDRENMDPILRLIEGNGNEWSAYQDDETPLGIDSRIAYFFFEPKDYYIEVGPKFTDTFGAYQFYIYRLTHGRTIQESTLLHNTLESAQMIAPSMPLVIHGAISSQEDVDVYRIVTDWPCAVDVVARRLGAWDDSPVDADIAVYNADHAEVARNSTWFEAPTCADPRVFLSEAGTYFIEISPAVKEQSDEGEKHIGFYAVNIRDLLVINEIDNRVTSEDPFVELLGPPDFDLTGYSLETFGEDGEPLYDSLLLDGTATDSAGYFYVSSLLATGLGDTLHLVSGSGAVVLRRNGQLLDSVQFGMLDTGMPYTEGHPAEVGIRRTIGRGAGVDTNNNDLDFIYMADPTPGAPNDRTFMSPIPLFGESDGCHNFKIDGDETGVDCGGSCGLCPDGEQCVEDDDCRSDLCEAGVCVHQEGCTDLKKNQDESDVDCGGVCPGCPIGAVCGDDTDCQSGNCDGGICAIPETCDDNIRNQDETDVDCGGTICEGCENGQICTGDLDCQSGFCDEGICAIPETCNDGLLNQNETDVDCGGVCPGCADGKICAQDIDCASGDCALGRCVTLTGTLSIPSPWGTGYCAYFKIKNNSQTPVSTWSAKINTKGFYPYIVWNIAFSGSSSAYTVTPIETWNHAINGGATVEVGGWCASFTGTNWQPVIVSIKGE